LTAVAEANSETVGGSSSSWSCTSRDTLPRGPEQANPNVVAATVSGPTVSEPLADLTPALFQGPVVTQRLTFAAFQEMTVVSLNLSFDLATESVSDTGFGFTVICTGVTEIGLPAAFWQFNSKVAEPALATMITSEPVPALTPLHAPLASHETAP
jgi:hypothetical protein